MEDTAVLYCHGPGCGSRSFLCSSGRYKGCDCGAAVGGGIQAVPIARGGMGNGGAWGRRTSFPAAPTALNCSGVHGDKLLNCMWKNSACHCLLRAARPAGPAPCGKIKTKCYRRSERHRQHLGPGEVEGSRCWKSAHVVICPPLGPRPPWQSCLPGAQGEGWHKRDPPRESGNNFPGTWKFPGPAPQHRTCSFLVYLSSSSCDSRGTVSLSLC